MGVNRLKRQLATEVERRLQLEAKRRETSETSSPHLAEGEDSLQNLQSKVVAISAEQDDWYDFAIGGSEKFRTAESVADLQCSLRKAVLERMVAHTTGIAGLQEQLTAKSAKSSR